MENLVNPAFWRGRRVFLTGHTGFKGSWLSLWLQSMGADVHGYALAPETTPALFEVADVARGMHSTLGDVRDATALHAAMAAARPEVVLHLAAQPLVPLSYETPVDTFATNVMGTVHLLDACRRVPGIRAVVVVSSDKCYENREQAQGYQESDPMGGHDPYSASKGCTELVVASYRRAFLTAQGIPVASARAGNVIGGGDWTPSRLVPDVLAAFAAGSPVTLRNPGAIRPWQHVLEPLPATCCLPGGWWKKARPGPKAGTSAPTTATRRPSPGWLSAWPKAGAPTPAGPWPTPPRCMRPTPSSSTAARPATAWAGTPAGTLAKPWPAAWPGTGPGRAAPTCSATPSTKSPPSEAPP